MIRSLRKRHQWTWIALLLALPVLLILAVNARRQVPTSKQPLPGDEITATGFQEVMLVPNAFGSEPIDMRLLVHPDGSRLLELTPRLAPTYPDALVYLGEPTWPTGNVLLGSLSGRSVRRFMLPDRAASTLHIYSLAHSRHVAQSTLPAAVHQEATP